MRKSGRWVVGQESVRPAGKLDECFYCNQKLGDIHKQECVIRERTVVIRFSVDLVLGIPEFWSAEDAEAFWNQGNFDIDDFHHELTSTLDLIGDDWSSPPMTAQFLREATEEDEEQQKFFVDDLPG